MRKSLTDWLVWIERTSYISRDNKTLDTPRELAQALDLLQTSAKVIIVTGTNGKGSCVEMLTSAYVNAGYHVGTYTSPHLLIFNERIRIQQIPVSDALLCEAFDIIEQARNDQGDCFLSYFEYVTLAAFWIFKHNNLDLIILEVGIGGRLDATNLMDADAAVITSIGLDHVGLLGNTREQIAQEKAGIFRECCFVVCGDPDPPETLINIAKQLKTQVYYANKDFFYSKYTQNKVNKAEQRNVPYNEPRWCSPPLKRGAQGGFSHLKHWSFRNHQHSFNNLSMPRLLIDNAATTLQTITVLNPLLPINFPDAINSIINTTLPGRCDVRQLPNGALIIFDVAHNPQAIAHFSHFLQQYQNKKIIALFSMLNDKDCIETIQVLKKQIHAWHVAEIDSPRRMTKEKLLQAFDVHAINPHWYPNIATASQQLLKTLKSDEILVVFGSFYVVADVTRIVLKSADPN